MNFIEGATVPGGSPSSGRGKLWVRSDTPNVLVFTDDTGADTVLGSGGGGGNVSNTGTPVNNQLAIWTDAATVEGDSSVTWDGTTFNADGAFLVNNSGADRDSRFEGDTLPYMLFLDASAATENIALLAASAPNWQSMDRGLFIGGASAAPAGNPSGGCFLWFNTSTNKLIVRIPSGDIIEIAGPV